MLEKMTLREKIGQIIMAGFPASNISPEYKRLVEEYKIGNTILFSHNIETSSQVRKLCSELAELIENNTGCQPFIAVDQEGGMVTRLPRDATIFPGAMAIAATGDPVNAYRAGHATGRELGALGINVNMAPVLDINSNRNNPVIGVRAFGDSKEQVSVFGMEMMKGLIDAQVLPIIKHFPGHGDTAVDSHIGLPVIDKSLSELMSNEIVPFHNAINNGAEAVMTSHILFPQIENNNKPATMSHRIITGLLREQLGFEGLVFSDCLEMDAVKKYYGTAKGALEAVKAGVNIVCISHTPELVEQAVKLMEEAVQNGELPVETIDKSVKKIIAFKRKYRAAGYGGDDIAIVGCPGHKTLAADIREKSITSVGAKGRGFPPVDSNTLFIGSYAGRSTLASSSADKSFSFPEYMAREFSGQFLLTSVNPTAEEMAEVLQKAREYKTVVYGTYNGHLNPGQLELVSRLCGNNENVIAVALRNPYDLGSIDARAYKLAAYEYTTQVFDILSEIFRGSIIPAGKLPVDI